jgi:hypothetical protein
MSELYPESSDDEDMFGREMICCTPIFKDCSKFKNDGYNCYGLNENRQVAPWGLKEVKEFNYFYKKKLFGSCKCFSQEIDYNCPCGILNISDDEDFNVKNLIYFSCFKELIIKRAENGSKLDNNALKYGHEVPYYI